MFPGLQRLSPRQQALYRAGLNANFNLGQMVQGEALPADLRGVQSLDEAARGPRLVMELYDFAGAAGHVRNDVSILMTEDTFNACLSVIAALMHPPLDQAYQRYITGRGEKAGMLSNEPDAFVLARIAALSRSFTTERGKAIRAVWIALPDSLQTVLRQELSEVGTADRPGILLYYAPAFIANAVESSGSFEKGLELSLLEFAKAFESARRDIDPKAQEPVVIVSVAEKARRLRHCHD